MREGILAAFIDMRSPRAARRFPTLAWLGGAIVMGGVLGGFAAVDPLLAALILLLTGAVLIWALPELRQVPLAPLRRFLYLAVAVQLCLPAYYAFRIGALPWISLRRLAIAVVIMLFLITIGGSKEARDYLGGVLRRNRAIATLTLGFFLMQVLSLPTSANPAFTLKQLVDITLTWFVPFACTLLVIRDRDQVLTMLRLIVWSIIVVSTLGLIEFWLRHKFLFDIFPQEMLDELMADNPLYQYIFQTVLRNGAYRAASIFSVSLSFAQFAAMASPLCVYFIVHWKTVGGKLLGAVGLLACVVALLISGSRGGMVGFVVAMSMFAMLWTARYCVAHRDQIFSIILLMIYPAGLLGFIGLIFVSRRVHRMLLGGGESQASTDARFEQFDLALPHILSNPLTGHGLGMAPPVIGFYPPGYELPSVDSYVTTLLVEVGIPGLVCFFGMLALIILKLGRIYAFNRDDQATIVAPIACALAAFGVYQLVLSQRENHTLAFILVGLAFVVAGLYGQIAQKAGAPAKAPRAARSSLTVRRV